MLVVQVTLGLYVMFILYILSCNVFSNGMEVAAVTAIWPTLL